MAGGMQSPTDRRTARITLGRAAFLGRLGWFMSFRVDLETFRGPLDLLLYLVRKHEVEILDIPIAMITEQFLTYLSVLEQLDVNAAGDFVEMASTLIEIKSRLVLPHGGEVEEPLEDPRKELVRQLLEYKKFKDAASILEERSRAWQERFPRMANDVPTRERDLADEPIHELELWDLVSAFGRVMREHRNLPGANILYDETPIHIYMSRIQDQMRSRGRVALGELFQPGMHKSTLVGMVLAILELVRHHAVRAEQNALFGEIWIMAGEAVDTELDPSAVSSYEHPHAEPTDSGSADESDPEASSP
jgi:segregation and condensation protein A